MLPGCRGGIVGPMSRRSFVSVIVVLAACTPPASEKSTSSPMSSDPPAPAPTADTKPPPPAPDPGPEPELPPGSADYSAALADARAYRRGQIEFAELQRRVVARGLPPHPLGDGYVIMPVPAPPPGVPFDPRIMPSDWKGTWGEIAMTHFAGQITRDEYDRLHRAAHPNCSQ